MQLSIKTNFPAIEAQLDALEKDIALHATASAVNKILDQSKTAMVREITSEYEVKADYVRSRLSVRRATRKAGLLAIEGTLLGGSDKGRAANIIAFVERKVTLAEARKRAKAGTLGQLFVKIKRNGGRKPLKGAFIGNKGRTVFEREGKGRLPIKPVQTIDVPQMFNTKRINATVTRFMLEKFPTIFAREVRFFTDRFNGGAR